MALRRKKYVAQTREILAKTRRKVTEALTAGGNGYVSAAKTPARGRPIMTDMKKARPYAPLTIKGGAKYPMTLPDARALNAWTNAMPSPKKAESPARACQRSHPKAPTATRVAATVPVPRPIVFHPT
jgi:hypothetical protein